MYFFVHNDELRNSYDTYKVIENLRKSGFKEEVKEVVNKETVVLIDNKKGRR